MSHLPITWVVCLVAVNPQNQILLIQRPFDKNHGGLWEFPGGKIEPGELPEQALRREVWEEINLEPHTLLPLTFYSYSYPSGPHVLMFIAVKSGLEPFS